MFPEEAVVPEAVAAQENASSATRRVIGRRVVLPRTRQVAREIETEVAVEGRPASASFVTRRDIGPLPVRPEPVDLDRVAVPEEGRISVASSVERKAIFPTPARTKEAAAAAVDGDEDEAGGSRAEEQGADEGEEQRAGKAQ